MKSICAWIDLLNGTSAKVNPFNEVLEMIDLSLDRLETLHSIHNDGKSVSDGAYVQVQVEDFESASLKDSKSSMLHPTYGGLTFGKSAVQEIRAVCVFLAKSLSIIEDSDRIDYSSDPAFKYIVQEINRKEGTLRELEDRFNSTVLKGWFRKKTQPNHKT